MKRIWRKNLETKKGRKRIRREAKMKENKCDVKKNKSNKQRTK